ncbi:hypothetical protein [Moraxella ovis]|uniref:hypothetical protein n=1 Tax=Moraxella ovis TaxID=29433 RepID=UPI000D8CA335|nr:hypothetical protein [Moraxella ovis]SPX82040.1 Uncharacterised protein [Moraxella ovis]STZ05701.1 Uncharacterised protein [Moraxella ovis]
MKPKLISEKEFKIIEGILAGWNGKLTWDDFTSKVAKKLNLPSLSKFTLMGYPEIKQAFLTRKQTLKEVYTKTIVVAPSGENVTVEMLIKENEALKEQLRMLKNDIKILETSYADKYRTWAYNLSLMPNVDMSRLNDPLPKIDHD